MRTVAATKMSAEGQVVIPEEIREQLGIEAGCSRGRPQAVGHRRSRRGGSLSVRISPYGGVVILRSYDTTDVLGTG